MKRKVIKIIWYSFAGLLLPATSLANACGEKFDLVVGNWADYIFGGDEGANNLISQFESLTGYKVKYVNYETNENLATFFDEFDLAVPSDYYVERFQKEGRLAAIDWSKMHIWDSEKNPLPENSQVETYDLSKKVVTKYDYDAGYNGYCQTTNAYDESDDCWNSINDSYYTSLNESRSTTNDFDMLKWSIPYNVGTVGMFVNTDRFNDSEKQLLEWNANPGQVPDWNSTLNWMSDHLKEGFLLGMTDDARNDYFVGANLHNSLFVNDPLTNLNNPTKITDVDKAFNALSKIVNLKNKWTLVKDNFAYEGVYDQNVLGNQLGAAFDYNGEAVNMISQYYSENPNASEYPEKYVYIIPNSSNNQPARNIWTDNFVINAKSISSKEKIIYEFLTFMSNFNSSYLNASYIGYNSGVMAVNQKLATTLSYDDIPESQNQAVKAYDVILDADLKNLSASTFRYLSPELRNELITTWNKFYIFFRNI